MAVELEPRKLMHATNRFPAGEAPARIATAGGLERLPSGEVETALDVLAGRRVVRQTDEHRRRDGLRPDLGDFEGVPQRTRRREDIERQPVAEHDKSTIVGPVVDPPLRRSSGPFVAARCTRRMSRVSSAWATT